jgi:hypothetical protein
VKSSSPTWDASITTNPALLGGLFIGILSALPIVSVGNCCCLWIICGGFLAAYVDAQNSPVNVPVGRGALQGFLAGIAGAFVWLIAAIALDGLLGPMQRQFAEAMAQRSQAMPPEVRQWLEAIADRSMSPARWIVGFMFQLFIGMIFAPIGGMLGAVYFKKDVPPALGGPPLPPGM